jgi:hypothetical protein
VDPNFIVLYDCDITRGTSGSAILGSDKLAQGVNDFEMLDDDTPWKGGVIVLKGNGIFDLIMEWSRVHVMPTAPVATIPRSSPTPPWPSGITPTTPTPSTCFSSNNLVEVVDIGPIVISKLKVGTKSEPTTMSFRKCTAIVTLTGMPKPKFSN